MSKSSWVPRPRLDLETATAKRFRVEFEPAVRCVVRHVCGAYDATPVRPGPGPPPPFRVGSACRPRCAPTEALLAAHAGPLSSADRQRVNRHGCGDPSRCVAGKKATRVTSLTCLDVSRPGRARPRALHLAVRVRPCQTDPSPHLRPGGYGTGIDLRASRLVACVASGLRVLPMICVCRVLPACVAYGLGMSRMVCGCRARSSCVAYGRRVARTLCGSRMVWVRRVRAACVAYGLRVSRMACVCRVCFGSVAYGLWVSRMVCVCRV